MLGAFGILGLIKTFAMPLTILSVLGVGGCMWIRYKDSLREEGRQEVITKIEKKQKEIRVKVEKKKAKVREDFAKKKIKLKKAKTVKEKHDALRDLLE